MAQFNELSDDEMETLPVDELAIEVLDDAVRRAGECNNNAGSWFLSESVRTHGAGAKQACKDAWGWLYANGLVANDIERQHASCLRDYAIGSEGP